MRRFWVVLCDLGCGRTLARALRPFTSCVLQLSLSLVERRNKMRPTMAQHRDKGKARTTCFHASSEEISPELFRFHALVWQVTLEVAGSCRKVTRCKLGSEPRNISCKWLAKSQRACLNKSLKPERSCKDTRNILSHPQLDNVIQGQLFCEQDETKHLSAIRIPMSTSFAGRARSQTRTAIVT